MTPYAIKLQSALIDTGKDVENRRHMPTPTLPEMEVLYDKFLQAIDKDDMMGKIKAARELTAALVKWQVEKF